MVVLIKQFIKNNSNGLLGTIIFHLALLVLFLGVKIKHIKQDAQEVIMIDFKDVPFEVPEPKKIALEEVFPDMNEASRSNKALNTAADFEKNISTEEYLEELKKDYNIDNMSDDQLKELEQKYSIKSDETGKEVKKRNPDVKENETNITFSLDPYRYPVKKHVPVYKCIGSAVVKLDITVDVKGIIVNVSVNSASQNNDPCFIEEAIASAKRWRFNADLSAPARQKGTMTFKFVAQ